MKNPIEIYPSKTSTQENPVYQYISIIILFFFVQCSPTVDKNRNNLLGSILLFLGGGYSLGNPLEPGSKVDLNEDGIQDGTMVDLNGDGVSDGIDLTGDGLPNLILIDKNEDRLPDSIDLDGNGIIDYHLSVAANGNLVISTGPGGSGSVVIPIDNDRNGTFDGFDLDGDGVINDNRMAGILSDKTPPQLMISHLGGIYSMGQSVELACSDNLAPGPIAFTKDGSIPAFLPRNGIIKNPPRHSLQFNQSGVTELRAYCIDLSGNVSTNVVESYTIDSNLPAISISLSSPYLSNRPGAISSTTATWRSDRNGSYVIRENSSSCSDGNSLVSGEVVSGVDLSFTLYSNNIPGEGKKEYRICVTATSGLVGSRIFSIERDDTPPIVSVSPGGGDYGLNTFINLVCSDHGGVGCSEIVYTYQVGSAPSNPAIAGETGNINSGILYTTPLQGVDANITFIKFLARDSAGNVSLVSSANYTIDSSVATIAINAATEFVNSHSSALVSWKSNRSGNYHLRIGGNDCASGTILSNAGGNTNVSGTIVNFEDTVNTTILSSSFNSTENTVRICIANLIGNFGSSSLTIKKDIVNPTVTINSPTGSLPVASGVQLNLSCNDTGGSGCHRKLYTLDGNDPSFTGNDCSIGFGSEYSSAVFLSDGNAIIKARSCDFAGNISSIVSSSIFVGPPSAPNDLVAISGNEKTSLSWGAVSGATNYQVFYSTVLPVTSSSTLAGTTNSLSYEIGSLQNGTRYYFAVRAAHSGGIGDLSSYATAVPTVPSQSPYFTEYMEGSANNKALEIYAPTGYDFANCNIDLYLNGSTTRSAQISLASVNLGIGGTHVLCHSSLNPTYSSVCNQLTNTLNFNGDDALTLSCAGNILDIFGKIGERPAAPGWTGSLGGTMDKTLRRKCSVTTGTTDITSSFNIDSEWDVIPTDTFGDLGRRNCP